MAVTTDDLRARLQKLGWSLREVPIRKGGPDSGELSGYKIFAVKGEKSIMLGGNTLHDAMSTMCKTVGAMAR